jgi:hypothetical protein
MNDNGKKISDFLDLTIHWKMLIHFNVLCTTPDLVFVFALS